MVAGVVAGSRKSPGLSEALIQDGRLSAGWMATFFSCIALMFGPAGLLAVTFGVLAEGLEAKTGWSHSAVSYGSTLVSLVVLATSPIQGYLVDRFGGRRVILVSFPIFAIGLMGLTFATASIAAFYVACIILAALGMGLWPLSYMKVVTGWLERNLGLGLGIVYTGLGLAVTIFPQVLGAGFSQLGWSGTYLAIGIAILVLVWPAAMLLLKEAPAGGAEDAPSSEAPVDRSMLGRAFRSKVFLICMPLFFVLGVANAALLIHGVATLKANGLPLKEALQVQSVVGLGAIAGRLGTGWFLDRLNVRVVGSFIFLLASVSFLVSSSQPTMSLAYVAAVCGGLVIGAEFAVLGVLIRRHLGTAVFGRVYGVVFSGFHFGGAAGSAGLAYLLSRTGSFSLGLQGLSAACLAGVALFYLVGRDPGFGTSKAASQ